MKMQSESILKKLMCEYIKAKYPRIFFWINSSIGVYDPVRKIYRKNNSKFQLNGVPDILGILPDGKFLGIEVKLKKGLVSDNQSFFLMKAHENHAICFIARDFNDIDNGLKDYKG